MRFRCSCSESPGAYSVRASVSGMVVSPIGEGRQRPRYHCGNYRLSQDQVGPKSKKKPRKTLI